jgi:hypothetical protein
MISPFIFVDDDIGTITDLSPEAGIRNEKRVQIRKEMNPFFNKN